MPAEFRLVNERVVLNKYIEPVRDADVGDMVTKLENHAKEVSQTVLLIADFTAVKQFPSTLLTMGLRKGNVNPVRNPKIDSIIVLTDSAFLVNLASAITRITGIKKTAFMRTQA